MGTLGALKVRDVTTGIEFNIGTGYTAAQRAELWAMWLAGTLAGKIAKYKHFEVGVKEAPRFPVFLGFRNPLDMGEAK
jgi:DNA ligase-1